MRFWNNLNLNLFVSVTWNTIWRYRSKQ